MSWPSPGTENTVSTTTVPPIIQPIFTPNRLMVGNRELRNTWPKKMIRAGTPFARAAVT